MRNIIVVLILLAAGSAGANEVQKTHHKSYLLERSDDVLRAIIGFAPVRAPEQQQDGLAAARARDQLLQPLGAAPSLREGAYGAALLGASIVLAAHAPEKLRPLFAGPVHLGPALMAGGGMGIAIGGVWR